MKDTFNALALVAPSPMQKEIGSVLKASESYASFVAHLEVLSRAMAKGFHDITNYRMPMKRNYCNSCAELSKGFLFSFTVIEEAKSNTFSFFLCHHCALVEVLFRSSDMRIGSKDIAMYRELVKKAAIHEKCLFCSAALDLFEVHAQHAASDMSWM